MDILLVEDNPSDAELTLLALRRAAQDLSIVHVEDGVAAKTYLEHAIIKLRQGEMQALPKLMLLDLKLPKLDGLELLRLIKANPDLAYVPVIIFTSSQEERDLVLAYQLGANSYTVKPVNFDDLNTILGRIVQYWLHFNVRPLHLDSYLASSGI
ncbi:response regulator [Parvibium lacunae]|uniref:Response regulator n=1 Tax=Parvibium lacunae TaxID=1888893 RepID=A0A368L3V1_9BURK|nr:response regulator [Parvibium lacunae]RCS58205.1 response regulator [Parvibium lacunae]